MTTTTEAEPTTGSLVSVRGQKWIAGDVDSSTLVTLQSVDEGKDCDTLVVIWEIEPGSRILASGSLPEVNQNNFDSPEMLAAFLDAIRWSAVTSADVKALQAPFRSGVAIENYQLKPVARAIAAPRVNLVLAEDVGIGKTIEADFVAQELLLRHRSHRIVCPAGLVTKWKDEMADLFGLNFTVINTETRTQVRREYGSAANPSKIYPLAIVSLRGCAAQRPSGSCRRWSPPVFLLTVHVRRRNAPTSPRPPTQHSVRWANTKPSSSAHTCRYTRSHASRHLNTLRACLGRLTSSDRENSHRDQGHHV